MTTASALLPTAERIVAYRDEYGDFGTLLDLIEGREQGWPLWTWLSMGLAVVLLELKASHKSVEQAYKKNLRDYRDTIPQLFTPNSFVILHDGEPCGRGVAEPFADDFYVDAVQQH